MTYSQIGSNIQFESNAIRLSNFYGTIYDLSGYGSTMIIGVPGFDGTFGG